MAEFHLSTDAPLSRLYKELEEAFPPQTIDPSMSHELILYRAGQRSVVEWINNKLSEEN